MNNATDRPSGKTHDVVLCHNSEDKPEVRQVYEALKVRGVWPWIDEVQILPGDSWQKKIRAALESTPTAAIFVGRAGGRVQVKEIEICIDLETQGKIRVIPVILPGCGDDSEIDPFLRTNAWVDFRSGDSDPLEQLCKGIGEFEHDAQPIVAVAPTSTSEERSRLIGYCQNAGLIVPRAGIYPLDVEAAARAFRVDLEYSHIVAQLDGPEAEEPTDEFSGAVEQIKSDHAHQNRIMHWRHGDSTRSEFKKAVVDRARRVFDVLRPDPHLEPGGSAVHSSGEEGADIWAMVKYDRVDAKPTRQMLRLLKEAEIHYTSSPNGSTTLAERMRERSFDALILVLGECDNDWLERRIDELAEVELTLKDQAPLHAYYYAEGATAVPPRCTPSTLEIDGPGEIDRLLGAIRGENR